MGNFGLVTLLTGVAIWAAWRSETWKRRYCTLLQLSRATLQEAEAMRCQAVAMQDLVAEKQRRIRRMYASIRQGEASPN